MKPPGKELMSKGHGFLAFLSITADQQARKVMTGVPYRNVP